MLGQVTVIGCGLIGGSIAKALAERKGAARVVAIDRADVVSAVRPFVAEVAVVDSREARELVARADLVVLAAPVGAIVQSLRPILDTLPPGGVVTDTGSVKQAILAAARLSPKRSRFVAGHPMAGRELGGFESSSATLFEGARWFLATDGDQASMGPDEDAVNRVAELARVVGAEPVLIEGAAHDRAMAYVSHAPQLVASALYAVAARNGVLGAAGPGFRDMTRIAGGPPSIWRDIFETNRNEIAAALTQLLHELAAPSALGNDEGLAAAIALLERAQTAKGHAAADSEAKP